VRRTIYFSAALLQELEQVQVELADHLVAGPDGRCQRCGELEPCRRRDVLTETLLRYGRLPQRRPGQVRAVITTFGWFAS
jgi:hypothetical protein